MVSLTVYKHKLRCLTTMFPSAQEMIILSISYPILSLPNVAPKYPKKLQFNMSSPVTPIIWTTNAAVSNAITSS